MLKRRSVNYGPNSRPLILWSGGLDSTWMLERFSVPVDVLSITMGHPERAAKEAEARAALKPKMLAHRYHEATLFIGCGITVGDLVNTAWIAAQHAKRLGLKHTDSVLYGGNCDDDHQTARGAVADKSRKVLDLFRVVYGEVPCPRYAWFAPEPSRAEQLTDLGPMADLTWSCRDPQPEPCGQCKPCKAINAARQITGETI